MNTPSILKWGNTAHITKMSIEGIVAVASLAAAITTILIATNIIAAPASLALVSAITNPAGIAVLFIAATYFAAQAYCSWKQMHKNEEMKQAETAKTGAEEAESFKNTIEATIKGLATKADLEKKADKTDVNTKLAEKLSVDKFNTQLARSLSKDSRIAELIQGINKGK